jgi:hypothetical protein
LILSAKTNYFLMGRLKQTAGMQVWERDTGGVRFGWSALKK